jgi:hypothetical protein
MADYTNPQQTLKFLKELVALAGSESVADEVFALIHHRDKRIEPHRRYCERMMGGRFRPDENSARVQQRLEWVINSYKKAQHQIGDKTALKNLAAKSYKDIPPVPVGNNTFGH